MLTNINDFTAICMTEVCFLYSLHIVRIFKKPQTLVSFLKVPCVSHGAFAVTSLSSFSFWGSTFFAFFWFTSTPPAFFSAFTTPFFSSFSVSVTPSMSIVTPMPFFVSIPMTVSTSAPKPQQDSKDWCFLSLDRVVCNTIFKVLTCTSSKISFLTCDDPCHVLDPYLGPCLCPCHDPCLCFHFSFF